MLKQRSEERQSKIDSMIEKIKKCEVDIDSYLNIQ